MSLKTLRIFVSSPGDVTEERVLTARVIDRLKDEFASRVIIEPIFWEHEPLRATESFQKQITKPSESDIVICILWSRLGTRLPSDITRADGKPYSSGTEYEFEDAVEAHRRKGIPDLLVYRKMTEPVVSLQDKKDILERLNQKEALDNFVNRWFHDSEEGTLVAAFHPFKSAANFEELLEIHLRKLILNRLPEKAGGEEAPSTPPSWTKGSPFRGLEVFDFEHAPIFFGRTRAIGLILDSLRQQAAQGRAFVLVLGMSGCGKSSLVRAGLLPLLTQPGVIEGIGLWRKAVMHPGDTTGDLYVSLANALLRDEALPELAADGTTAKELADILRDNPKGAFPLVKGALSQAAAELQKAEKLSSQPEAKLVMVVDQFEEMFTIERITREERAGFVNAISALARSGRVWVIATLRSDFYPRCVELPELMKLKEGSGQHDLFPPTAIEIGQMIRQPAMAAGLKFEKDPETEAQLDEVLRDAAASDPASLPLLEFALNELYKKRTEKGFLTHFAYRELGGLEGAIANRAEEVFQRLDGNAQNTLSTVLSALITVGVEEEEAVARKRASLDSVCTSSETKRLVDAFVEARLFMTDLSDDGTAVLTFSHEALIHNWPRVQEWVEENREFLRVRARVAASAARWLEEDKATDFLLTEGKPLAEAEHLLDVSDKKLESFLREYIRSSVLKQRRIQKRKRLLAGTIFLVVLMSAVFSSTQWKKSEEQSEMFEQQLYLSNILMANDYLNTEKYTMARHSLWESPERMRNWEWGYLALQVNREILTLHGSSNSLLYFLDYTPDGNYIITQGNKSSDVWDAKTGALLDNLNPPDCYNVENLSYEVDNIINLQDNQILSDLSGKEIKVREITSGAEIYTLSGHTGEIMDVKFSPDGTKIITASRDSTAKVWDAATGAEIYTLSGHTKEVWRAEFSLDGTKIITIPGIPVAELVFSDSTLNPIVWDTNTGEKLYALSGHKLKFTRESCQAEFSPDGSLIKTKLLGGLLKLWDAETGIALLNFEDTFPAEFSPDGSRMAMCSGPSIKILDTSSRNILSEYSSKNTFKYLWNITYSPDGSLILGLLDYESDKYTAVVLDGFSGKELYTLPGSFGLFGDFSPDGSKIATVSEKGIAKIWNSANGELLETIIGHEKSVRDAKFSPDGSRIITASVDGTAKIWDCSMNPFLVFLSGLDSVKYSNFSPDNSEVITVEENGRVKLWGTYTGNELQTLNTKVSGIPAFSPDNKRMAAVCKDNLVKIWAAFTFEELLTINCHTNSVNIVEFSSDGSMIATASNDSTVKVWDTITGEEILTIAGHSAPVNKLVFSPNGSRLVTGSKDNRVKLWNATTGELINELGAYTGDLEIKFSPDGSIIIKSFKEVINILNASDGTEIASLDGSRAYFSPDGSKIIVLYDYYSYSGADRLATVYDSPKGEEISSLIARRNQQHSIETIVFSQDGSRILTVGSDSLLTLWDAESNTELLTLVGCKIAKFSPDGLKILTMLPDSRMAIYVAAPWRLQDLPGDDSMDWQSRFELWKKQQYQKRLAVHEIIK